jgi:hypothetical protein
MSRGIRTHTREIVRLVHEQKPFAIGPMLGVLAMRFNMSAGMMGQLLGVHEQTVLRWYMADSEPSASAYRKIAPIITFLMWLTQEEIAPFTGGAKKRKSAFAKAMREYLALE